MAEPMVELAANFSKGRGRCWGRLYLDTSAAFNSIFVNFLLANSAHIMAITFPTWFSFQAKEEAAPLDGSL